jgi:hypothetical protein
MSKQPSVQWSVTQAHSHLQFLGSTLRELSLSVSIGYRPHYLCSDSELCRIALNSLDSALHELSVIEDRLPKKHSAK